MPRLAAVLFLLAAPVLAQGPTEARVLIPGDYPDPTILRDGDTYYLTHSSHDHRPGLLIWKSDDFRTWKPLAHAVTEFPTTIWAPDLAKHDGQYFIYFTGYVDGAFSNWAVTAEKMEGPWSAPIDLKVGSIDPGHVVDQDGNRFLHLSGGQVAPLAADGVTLAGPKKKVLEGWPIPDDWAVECFCLESPKLTLRDGWYHLTCAQGGTFGPSTSHMVTSFRSRSATGPWEISPHNPVIRTWSRDEAWWSKGHATLVEAPDGQWFAVLHGIPNGQRTLGRATLIEPIEWTDDGWYRVAAEWPEAWDRPFIVDFPLSDEFDVETLGLQWQFHGELNDKRFSLKDGHLVLKGQGDSPADSHPLVFTPRDAAYAIETEFELTGEAHAGLIFFGSPNTYLGHSIDPSGQVTRRNAGYRHYKSRTEPKLEPGRYALRIVNDHQDVRFYVRTPSSDWKLLEPSMDISENGLVRPALYVSGDGEARFDFLHYRPLDD